MRVAIISTARKGADAVVDAVRDGREAMHAKEAELRAQRDGVLPTLADELEPHDRVLVDGRPVQPGQVIVLRQVREGREGHEGREGQRRSTKRTRREA